MPPFKTLQAIPVSQTALADISTLHLWLRGESKRIIASNGRSPL